MVKKKDALEEMKKQVVTKIDESRKQAEKEMAKVKRHVDASIRKVEDFVKKNPEKAAAISAGIGAALGAALALLVGGGKKNGKKK